MFLWSDPDGGKSWSDPDGALARAGGWRTKRINYLGARSGVPVVENPENNQAEWQQQN